MNFNMTFFCRGFGSGQDCYGLHPRALNMKVLLRTKWEVMHIGKGIANNKDIECERNGLDTSVQN